MTKYSIICYYLVIVIFCCECNSDRDQDGIVDSKDKCPDIYAKTKTGCPPEVEISHVNLFIETSASMAGYFQKTANFKTVISRLATEVNATIKPVSIWFIGDSLRKYKNTVQQFNADISLTNFATDKSSELHKIITKVTENTNSTSVSLFVSDCILSCPDSAIKKNSEINVQTAPSELRNTIFATFLDLKKNGFATSVYAFKSEFYTNPKEKIYYYDYLNGKKEIDGGERPFYVWAIAKKDVLVKFDEALFKVSSFAPEEQYHFGIFNEPIKKIDVLYQIGDKGKWKWKWQKRDTTIEDIEPDKENKFQFGIAINLKNLPEYARQLKYLKDSLKIEAEGCDLPIWRIEDKQTVDRSRLKTKPQIEIAENATHFIIVTISNLRLSETNLHVYLPLHYDTWYQKWSTMDDRIPSNNIGKTFAFEYLIDGVKQAYEANNKNYIDFEITLKK